MSLSDMMYWADIARKATLEEGKAGMSGKPLTDKDRREIPIKTYNNYLAELDARRNQLLKDLSYVEKSIAATRKQRRLRIALEK